MKETPAHLDYSPRGYSKIKDLQATHNTTVLLGTETHKQSIRKLPGKKTLGTGWQKDGFHDFIVRLYAFFMHNQQHIQNSHKQIRMCD